MSVVSASNAKANEMSVVELQELEEVKLLVTKGNATGVLTYTWAGNSASGNGLWWNEVNTNASLTSR